MAFLRDYVPLIGQNAIVYLAMAQAKAQQTGLVLNTIPRAPLQPGQQIVIANFPPGIGLQHSNVFLAPEFLGFKHSSLGPVEAKPRSLFLDRLITAPGEAGL